MSFRVFGELNDGRKIHAYTLTNELGMEVTILNYGGIIQSIKVPVAGKLRETVLGYDTFEDYLINPPYLGATIGRTAGRIQNGKLKIDDQIIQLNDGEDHLLHGGPSGFHQKYMTTRELELPNGKQLRMSFDVEEAEDGFPGDLEMEISYQLLKHENVLKVSYKGYSNKKTYLNLTNHSYFNLSFNHQETVANHRLELNAHAYASLDPTMIPNEIWTKVKGTALDFTQKKLVGEALAAKDDQIVLANGVDHPFLIQRQGNVQGFVEAAHLESPDRMLSLDVYTTQRHLVVYTGNFLHEACVPSGKTFVQNQGICFETQECPNMVNTNPELCFWTSPGEPYHEEFKYVFNINAQ